MDQGTRANAWGVVAMLLGLLGVWGVVYADHATAGTLTLDLVLAGLVLWGAHASFRKSQRIRAGRAPERKVSRWLEARTAEGANIRAFQAYRIDLENQVERLAVGARPVRMPEAPLEWAEPWLLVRLHGRSVQAARKAVDPNGRGHWGLVDEDKFTAEAWMYLAARTGWDPRAVGALMQVVGDLGAGRMPRTAGDRDSAEKSLREIDVAYKAAPERTHRDLLQAYDRQHGYAA